MLLMGRKKKVLAFRAEAACIRATILMPPRGQVADSRSGIGLDTPGQREDLGGVGTADHA